MSKLLYPPKVWSNNTPRAHETGEPEIVDYECYQDAMRRNKVGDVLRHHAGAPGVGYTDYKIVRMDETGVYAEVLENTIWMPDGDFYV